jgi:glycosyltransferase involved in cell wall biosynthesis
MHQRPREAALDISRGHLSRQMPAEVVPHARNPHLRRAQQAQLAAERGECRCGLALDDVPVELVPAQVVACRPRPSWLMSSTTHQRQDPCSRSLSDTMRLQRRRPMRTDPLMPQQVSSISVVIPAYRSAASLPDLVNHLMRELPSITPEHEILLVNDASPDETWTVIKGLAADNANVEGINLLRNYGQHNALLAGVRAAKGSIIVTMDDDLQHRPDEIASLISALTEDVDLVYGYASTEEHVFWRNLASQFSKVALASALGIDVARRASAFRAFRSCLRDAFADNRDCSVALDVLLSWGTTRVAAVPVRMDERQHGRSNYTVRKLLTHALNLMTGYSTAPLRAVVYLGLVMAVFGLCVMAFVVGQYMIHGRTQPGFAFIASIVALFSGAQLAALGILGEYLGRVHFRTMGRPSYAVRETTHTAVHRESSDEPRNERQL